ncbi:hypothetical protein CLOSCI_01010 [[Clostridium] scindens ATCC 35704]|nr:hypothetical protein CLOSCI_01010 [[Clostridium] scindens ATCC 35704]
MEVENIYNIFLCYIDFLYDMYTFYNLLYIFLDIMHTLFQF